MIPLLHLLVKFDVLAFNYYKRVKWGKIFSLNVHGKNPHSFKNLFWKQSNKCSELKILSKLDKQKVFPAKRDFSRPICQKKHACHDALVYVWG